MSKQLSVVIAGSLDPIRAGSPVEGFAQEVVAWDESSNPTTCFSVKMVGLASLGPPYIGQGRVFLGKALPGSRHGSDMAVRALSKDSGGIVEAVEEVDGVRVYATAFQLLHLLHPLQLFLRACLIASCSGAGYLVRGA